MEKFTAFLEKYLIPVAGKVQGNKYLSSVSDGFAILLPIIMIGAIATLFGTLQVGGYQAFLVSVGAKPIFGFISAVTTDALSIYAVLFIAYSFTKKRGFESNSLIVGGLSLFAFLLLIPLGVSGTAAESKELVSIAGAIPTGFLGARGLFMAIIVGLLTPTIYLFVIEKGWVIKLPDSVPPTIGRSFSALIPAFVVAISFALIRFGFSLTAYGHANQFVYSFLQQPLQALGSNPLSIVGFIIVAQVLWFFGIHGFMVVLPFLQTMLLPLSLENLAAYEAGLALPNPIVWQTFGTYILIGGSGATLGLAIIMAFAAKSQRYKTLGRLSLPSVIAGINEPIVFGTPMVLNPLMIVPFIFTPILMFLIPYALTIAGIIEPLRGIALPLGTPVLLYGWLQGGLQILLVQAVLIVVQAVVYFPFFRILDKQALADETAENA